MYDREYIDEFHLKMEKIVSENDTKEAYFKIVRELEKCEDKYLPELMGTLNYIQYEPVLDWIEKNAYRPKNISQFWGHLAASSKFNWERGKKWLESGRPLSLVALDAIMFCTTKDERLNQSPWMRKINPRLPVETDEVELVKVIKEYLKKDSVPRTKNVINKIIENIYEKNKAELLTMCMMFIASVAFSIRAITI